MSTALLIREGEWVRSFDETELGAPIVEEWCESRHRGRGVPERFREALDELFAEYDRETEIDHERARDDRASLTAEYYRSLAS